jgi:hypothetical protein
MSQTACAVAASLCFLVHASVGSAQGQQVTILKPCVAVEKVPTPVNSPVKVEWKMVGADGGFGVVQVYQGGEKTPIWPKERPESKPSENGVSIALDPGVYEIKVWIPRTMVNQSTWVRVQRQPVQQQACR